MGERAVFDLESWLELVSQVEDRAPLVGSDDHGAHHWRLVCWTGAELLQEVPEAHSSVVLLFGLFHDSQRKSEHADGGHGRRAGLLARELLGNRPNIVDPAQLEVLVDACNRHTGAGPTVDPTLGVCWDADRLNLWRVGIRPHPRLLSTAAARRPERIAWADGLQSRDFSWEEIGSRFGLSGAHVGEISESLRG